MNFNLYAAAPGIKAETLDR